MHSTNTSSKGKNFKIMIWSLLLLLFISIFIAASAESMGYFTGRVWNDLNNNGLMDPDEPAVPGVNLHLTRQDTGEILTAVSDETGIYTFADLPNDSYAFTVELPPAMLMAHYTSEGDYRSIITGDDEDNYRNFIVRANEPLKDMNVGLIDSAIIQGITYLDMNYNGQYDEGEPPYPGLKLQFIRNFVDRPVQEVITGEDGVFVFDYVRKGNYRFRAIVPDDGSSFTMVPDQPGYFSNLFVAREGRRENSVDDIDVENGMVYEYYIGVALGGTISGTVFNDKDYSGVKNGSDSALYGVAVQLVSTNGTVVSEISTNKKGNYTLRDVMPGTYTLRFLRKSGYTFTKYRPQEQNGNDAVLAPSDSYGETEPFSVAMSETLTDYNAGMVQAATLSGVFFYDVNDNGLMDKDETGFVDGNVRLVSTDGEIDLTQTVDADGAYLFSGVPPTEYTLYYNLPEHSEMAKVSKGGNTLAHQGLENAVTGLKLKAKKKYTQPLVGAVKLGTFEGFAFEDLNANGVMDAGENPVAGVSVTLTTGNSDARTVTGEGGAFSITDLRPGHYTLTLQLPDGLIFSGDIPQSGIPLGRTNTYSDSVLYATLLRHYSNAVGVVAPATLQASTWLDANMNGQRDDGEPGVGGLHYTLLDETSQQTIATAVSAADGTVIFDSVRPSVYTVSYALPAESSPVSGVGTMTQAERSMQQSGIMLSAGQALTGIDSGIVSTTSLGGTILSDRIGGRTPVSGAEVHLYRADDSAILQTTHTDANGVYRFDGLWPGAYMVEVFCPDDYVFTRPDDPDLAAGDSIITQINGAFGTSDGITLSMAKNQLDLNVLLTIPAKVGSLVWLDENANGLIDINEPMIGGVSISLMQNGETIYTTSSNEWGYYEFTNVYPGEYVLQASAYPELDITMQVPAVPIISSCLALGDGSIALSDLFRVESQSLNYIYHLGYVLKKGETMPPEATQGGSKDWTYDQ